MPLDGPSGSQSEFENATLTNRNDSEVRGKGDATGLANGSATVARPKRSKGKGSGAATPVPLDEQKSPDTLEEPSFENNMDFIAFQPEPHERPSQGDNEESRAGEQDRDTAKFRERDGGDSKKRKLDVYQNDGYNNKKQRMDAASRKAPWVTDVDWEGSPNVAELYVFSP